MSRLLPLLALLFLSCNTLQPFSANAQSSPRNERQLRQAIDAVLADDAFKNANWSVKIVDLETRKTVYERNAGLSFIPASNTKLYTTAAALDQLGPDYRYQTPLYADGEIVDGVLHGNLIVRGTGDPVIGGRFNDGDLTETFRQWAEALKAAGIYRIDGDIIGDDDVFDDQPLGYGWSWDDEPFWYSAEISGLSFNDNCIDFTIHGQTAGMPGRVEWAPHNTSYIQVINQTVTIAADSSIVEGYVRPRGTNTFTLSSLVPESKRDLESLMVTNPTHFFVHVLRETLLQQGIPVRGRPVDVDDLSIKPDYAKQTLREIAVHTSHPMADIVQVINKRSHNLYAEQVLKTLGAAHPVEEGGEDYTPGSAEMGIAAAMRTFARAAVDTSRIQLRDGSGLSRMNLVTADMTNSLLQYMWHHPDSTTRAAFYDSLPIGGLDGTLQYRYPDGPARGNVHAKTGTVSNASTLSGYVRSATETPLAFVLMCNHYTVPTSRVRAAQDAIVDLLASYRK